MAKELIGKHLVPAGAELEIDGTLNLDGTMNTGLTASRVLVTDGSSDLAVSAVTSTELGYLDDVTSSIQTQLNGKQATLSGATSGLVSSNLTASRALASNASGKIVATNITSTELDYLDDVTSSIQTQLNGKSPTAGSGSIVTVGTIGSGTWQGTAIASAYLDTDTAHLSGVQAFTGAKSMGSNGAGVDFTLHSGAADDHVVWDASAKSMTFTDCSIAMAGAGTISAIAPTANGHVATKSYVDSEISEAVQGLNIKESVKLATVAALSGTWNYNNGTSGVGATLTAAAQGVQAVDGVNISANDRILVKNQSTGAQNGVYKVTTAGAVGVAAVLTRADDYDLASEIDHMPFVFVEAGTDNQGNGFVQTSAVATIGSDAFSFTQFSGAGQITAGGGLAKDGNELEVDCKANGGILVDGNGELALDLGASSITGALANGDLANSTVSFGGVTLSLGGQDATPAFDLADSTNTNLASIKGGTQLAIASGGTGTNSLATDGIIVGPDSGSAALRSVSIQPFELVMGRNGDHVSGCKYDSGVEFIAEFTNNEVSAIKTGNTAHGSVTWSGSGDFADLVLVSTDDVDVFNSGGYDPADNVSAEIYRWKQPGGSPSATNDYWEKLSVQTRVYDGKVSFDLTGGNGNPGGSGGEAIFKVVLRRVMNILEKDAS